MLRKWFQEHFSSAILLTLIRFYLGYIWISSGVGKVTGDFDASGYLQGAIAKSQGQDAIVQGWWAAFLKNFALPYSEVFSFLVMWGEVLVGLALLLGLFTKTGAFFGIVMNVAFLLSGTISTNPEMVIMAGLILAGGMNASRIGIEPYVKPYLYKQNIFTEEHQKAS
ncbi:DoxX family membrane protein [Halobacillus sp. Marseille-Q1614]|uniref:DoxX family membrane protein n=1 Tax=Halobacillus sp. Marseille-Q1614 TaxID=2709134 RepID=UPI00156D6A0E|nr:DoxX family protein [Halobacillus sp. Marseille-Q1614]